MCVNSFQKDARDKSNSIVRAMAIRTMGCLRVKDLNEYLIAPLLEALSDDDSYVKKVALMTVPKINELSPGLVQKSGILTKMQQIVKGDINAYVVANALSALSEIERTKLANKWSQAHRGQRTLDIQDTQCASGIDRQTNKSGARYSCWTSWRRCPSKSQRCAR